MYWYRGWCCDRGIKRGRIQVSRNSRERLSLSREDERQSARGML